MLRTAGDIVSSFSLSSCVRCGICDSVCPSGRNGGIHPDGVIYALTDAPATSDARDVRADVWKCLMCHRCSMNCPEDIDVAGAIRSLRYLETLAGSYPGRFVKASGLFASDGRAFPAGDAVNKKRADLGLSAIETDAASVAEIKRIKAATGFRHE